MKKTKKSKGKKDVEIDVKMNGKVKYSEGSRSHSSGKASHSSGVKPHVTDVSSGGTGQKVPHTQANCLKISDKELLNCLENHMSQADIARKFGMNKITVFRRVHKLGKKGIRALLIKDSEDASPQLKTFEQLAYINEEALSIIQDKTMPKVLKLQAMKRVESQNEFQSRLFQMLHSIQEVKEFQKVVLEVLHEASPELREKVITKLRARKTTAALLGVA